MASPLSALTGIKKLEAFNENFRSYIGEWEPHRRSEHLHRRVISSPAWPVTDAPQTSHVIA